MLKNLLIPKKDSWAWLFGFAFLMLYLLLPVKVFFNYDPYLYASEAVSPITGQWFNPHHLLFSRTHWLFYELVHFFSPHAGILSTMSWLNSFFGALALVLFYRLTYKFSGKAYISILLTLVLGTSLGFYLYSTVGEIVVPTCFWLLLTLTVALGGEIVSRRRALATGLCFAAALLFHESASIYIVLILAILIMRSLPEKRWGNLAILLAGTIVPVVIAYVLVLTLAEGLEPSQWYRWLSGMVGSGTWLKGTPDKIPSAIAYWLNTANHSFLANDTKVGDLWWWVLLNRIATWGLVAFALAAVITFTRRKNYLGIWILINIVIAIGMANWWEYNCWDFYVFPFILLLLLIAWGARGWWSLIIAGWLIFYLPLTAVFNWQSNLMLVTDPSQEVLSRSVNTLGRIYNGKDVLVLNSYDCLSEICVFSYIPTQYSRDFQNENEMLHFILARMSDTTAAHYTVVSEGIHQQVLNSKLYNVGARDRRAIAFAFTEARVVVDLGNSLNQKVRFWELGKPEIEKINSGQ